MTMQDGLADLGAEARKAGCDLELAAIEIAEFYGLDPQRLLDAYQRTEEAIANANRRAADERSRVIVAKVWIDNAIRDYATAARRGQDGELVERLRQQANTEIRAGRALARELRAGR